MIKRIGERFEIDESPVRVSERDRAAAEPLRCECYLLGRSCIREFVPLARFGDVPVLTKSAAEIASSGAKREDARPRQKMAQRFLLDWIDTKPGAPAISGEHHLIAHALPNETKSSLPFIKLAKSRTDAALNAPIRQHRPPSTGIIRLRQHLHHPTVATLSSAATPKA